MLIELPVGCLLFRECQDGERASVVVPGKKDVCIKGLGKGLITIGNSADSMINVSTI
jgi:hypothetical protein